MKQQEKMVMTPEVRQALSTLYIAATRDIFIAWDLICKSIVNEEVKEDCEDKK